ncbi:uncharacterized protein LOC133195955 [Saccostrea echinata]|uniref:uncharacterized protein LOC133195955 n=1 Tax=Saccostrea echinata TaxID=191078 RepID=UPI002A81579B|nr:uncharacterized protein LOC133195955 [Saccostrea echinata]
MLALKNSRVASKAVHSPKDWTYRELKEIDSLLRCPICYDFIHTAMILPECSHTFCSFCIRQHLSHTNKCPICNSAACENNLRNNRLVDDVILQFKSIRSRLLEITMKHSTDKDVNYCNFNKKTLQDTKTQSLLPISKNTCNIATKDVAVIDLVSEDGDENEKDFEDQTSNEDKENITEVDQGFCTPKAKAGTQFTDLNKIGESSSSKTWSPSYLGMFSPSPRKMVPCPVCGISLKESAMNDHLDICLGGEEKKSALRKQTPKRKPMAKLVYNLMSEREIKKKMKEVGLSTTGDKKALIRRHHDFVMLYNSECDSLKPRSVQDIVKEVEKMEDIRIRNRRDNNRLGIEKNSSPASIEKAQKVYLKKHKSHFSNLIEETRRRMREQKAERKKSSDVKEKNEESQASDSELGGTGTECTQSESEGDSRTSEGDSRRTSSRNGRNKETGTRRGTDVRIAEIDMDYDVKVVSSQSESESKVQRRSTRNKERTKKGEVHQLETSALEACDVEVVSLESDSESENARPLQMEHKRTRSRNTHGKTSEGGTEQVLTDTIIDDESGRRKSLRTRKKADADKAPCNSRTHVSQNQRIHDRGATARIKSRNKPVVGKKTGDSVCEVINVDKAHRNRDGFNKYDGQSIQRRIKRNYSKFLSHSESSKSKKTYHEGEVEEISDTSDVEMGMDEPLEELNIEESQRKDSTAVFEHEGTSGNVLGVEKRNTEVIKCKTTSSSPSSSTIEVDNSEDKFVCVASVHRNKPSADLIINVPVDLEKIDWAEEGEDDRKREKIQRQFLGSPIRIPEINRTCSSAQEDGEILSCDDNMDENHDEKDGKKQKSNPKKSIAKKVRKNSSEALIGHSYDVDHNERDVADLRTLKTPDGKSESLLSEEHCCQEKEKLRDDQDEEEGVQVDETPVKDYDVENFSTLWPALSGGADVSRARARHFSSMSTQSNKSNCSDLSAVSSPIKIEEDIQEERSTSRSSSRREILGDFENRKRKRLSEPASRKRRRR